MLPTTRSSNSTQTIDSRSAPALSSAQVPKPACTKPVSRTGSTRPSGKQSDYCYDAIPEELRQRRQWVVWVLDGKNKIPFCPHPTENTGCLKKASTTNPTTWGTFEEAISALQDGFVRRAEKGYVYRTYPTGIGFVFTPDDPYVGIDFDDCYTDGLLNADVQATLDRMQTYCEQSCSLQGVKAIGRADAHVMKTKSVEIYIEGRFFALTGRVIPGIGTEVQDVQEEVDALLQRYGSPRQTLRSQSQESAGTPQLLDERFIRWLEHNPRRLFDADGLPHVANVANLKCSASKQLHDLIVNGVLPKALAKFNDSSSERRAVVASSTQRMGMRPEERYVLLKRLTERYGWGEKKRTSQLDADFKRLIFEKYPVEDCAVSDYSRDRYNDFRRAPASYEMSSRSADSSVHSEEVVVKPKARRGKRRTQERSVELTRRMLVALANEDGVLYGSTTELLTREFNKRYSRERSISNRTMRDYMRCGKDLGLWVIEQEGGNGRPVMTLKPSAFCHPKRAKDTPRRVTDPQSVLTVAMPQTMVHRSQCIEGGSNTPVCLPGTATIGQPLPAATSLTDCDVAAATNDVQPMDMPLAGCDSAEAANNVQPTTTPQDSTVTDSSNLLPRALNPTIQTSDWHTLSNHARAEPSNATLWQEILRKLTLSRNVRYNAKNKKRVSPHPHFDSSAHFTKKSSYMQLASQAVVSSSKARMVHRRSRHAARVIEKKTKVRHQRSNAAPFTAQLFSLVDCVLPPSCAHSTFMASALCGSQGLVQTANMTMCHIEPYEDTRLELRSSSTVRGIHRASTSWTDNTDDSRAYFVNDEQWCGSLNAARLYHLRDVYTAQRCEGLRPIFALDKAPSLVAPYRLRIDVLSGDKMPTVALTMTEGNCAHRAMAGRATYPFDIERDTSLSRLDTSLARSISNGTPSATCNDARFFAYCSTPVGTNRCAHSFDIELNASRSISNGIRISTSNDTRSLLKPYRMLNIWNPRCTVYGKRPWRSHAPHRMKELQAYIERERIKRSSDIGY